MADPYTNHDVISATLFQIKGPGQLGIAFSFYTLFHSWMKSSRSQRNVCILFWMYSDCSRFSLEVLLSHIKKNHLTERCRWNYHIIFFWFFIFVPVNVGKCTFSIKKAIFWDKRFLPFVHNPTFNPLPGHPVAPRRWTLRIWLWIVNHSCVLLVLFWNCSSLSRPVDRRVGFVKHGCWAGFSFFFQFVVSH